MNSYEFGIACIVATHLWSITMLPYIVGCCVRVGTRVYLETRINFIIEIERKVRDSKQGERPNVEEKS